VIGAGRRLNHPARGAEKVAFERLGRCRRRRLAAAPARRDRARRGARDGDYTGPRDARARRVEETSREEGRRHELVGSGGEARSGDGRGVSSWEIDVVVLE